MEKKLVLKKPMIITYVYEGYMLGIMEANGDAYKEWMLSNYIQLNCHENIMSHKELFLAFYSEVAIKSPFLKSQKISWAVLRNLDLDLINLFKSHIDLGWYLYFKVDDYYIPNRHAYNKYKYLHDEMIIGYDENNFILFGYDDKGKCSKQKIPYSQFINALNSNDSSIDKNQWQDDIFFLRYVDSDYKLNVNAINTNLYDYLMSKNSAEVNNQFVNSLNDTVYGLRVYDKVIEYLNVLYDQGNIFYGGENIDNRIFRIIMEHKNVMLERIKVLNSKFGGLDDIYQQYENINRKAQYVHMLAIKYQLKSNKKYLIELIDGVQFIKESDEEILWELHKRLKKMIM